MADASDWPRVLSKGDELLGRFTLKRWLGRGARAQIWCARDAASQHDVALRIELAPSDRSWRALEREYAFASYLRHPRLLPVEPPLREPMLAALPMRLAVGDITSLAGAPYFDVLTVLIDVGTALQFAHDQGLTHGGLRTSRVLITAEGRAWLAGFGRGDPSRPAGIEDDVRHYCALAAAALDGVPALPPRLATWRERLDEAEFELHFLSLPELLDNLRDIAEDTPPFATLAIEDDAHRGLRIVPHGATAAPNVTGSAPLASGRALIARATTAGKRVPRSRWFAELAPERSARIALASLLVCGALLAAFEAGQRNAARAGTATSASLAPLDATPSTPVHAPAQRTDTNTMPSGALDEPKPAAALPASIRTPGPAFAVEAPRIAAGAAVRASATKSPPRTRAATRPSTPALALLRSDAVASAEREDWPRAIQGYAQILALDPTESQARAGLAAARKAIGGDEYGRAVVEGFIALGRGRLESARVAFARAQVARPAGSEAQLGITRVNAAIAARSPASILREARRLEADERWEEAHAQYASAVAVHPESSEAKLGAERTSRRAQIVSRIGALLANPESVATPAGRAEGLRLLERARTLEPAGPRLRSQIARLSRRLDGIERRVTLADR